ncbi:MAG TPA: tryptophan synthase subunit alpha [Firmicutes bacterium]|jgi:tryptophan synthase alpha chain|nr:tryptophan synthase subunit alpha [Candidatus Fermentithermobacillaceae bacterium]
MNELSQVFAGGKAFIPFITAGDPSIEVTQELVPRMQKAGADLIEIGIPFSDPIGEGSTIQEASIRALSRGVNVDKIFSAMEFIREFTDVPVAFMAYANTVFSYGSDKFVKRCKDVSVQGLIVGSAIVEIMGAYGEECIPYVLEYVRAMKDGIS